MIITVSFISLVFALFITIRQIQQSLFSTFYRITGSLQGAVWFSSLVYLPGTFIHELSHLVMAIATLHDVAAFSLLPHTHQNGEKLEIHMGSVTYYHKDPFRGFLVGIAPFITGILLLYMLFLLRPIILGQWWGFVLWGYAVFAVASTMFTSPADMKDAPVVLLFFFALAIGIWFLSPHVYIVIGSWLSTEQVASFFSQVNWYLSFALGGNILLYICLQSSIRIYESLRARN
jgi:hypothetical protein